MAEIEKNGFDAAHGNGSPEMLRALKVEPGKSPVPVTIPNTLKSL